MHVYKFLFDGLSLHNDNQELINFYDTKNFLDRNRVEGYFLIIFMFSEYYGKLDIDFVNKNYRYL